MARPLELATVRCGSDHFGLEAGTAVRSHELLRHAPRHHNMSRPAFVLADHGHCTRLKLDAELLG